MHNILLLKNNIASHCEVITYPDGQHSCKVDLQYYDVKTPIHIKCRIKTFAELELLLCVVAALRKNDRIIHEIEFMYLFGMRSDRAFSEGEPNYFRDVVAPIINNIDIKRIKIWSPHNFMQLAYFNNEATCEQPFLCDDNPHSLIHPLPLTIAGDKSACVIWDTEIYFHKLRTQEGIEVELECIHDATIKKYNSTFPILIVDDLCDGGATFIAEAKYLHDLYPERKLQLFVTHGIFSKGFDELMHHFDHIYITNSYDDFLFDSRVHPNYPLYANRITIIDIWEEK